MAKETEPKTYRVSPEVDTELRRLAKIHGGVDRALRVILGSELRAGGSKVSENRSPRGYKPLLKVIIPLRKVRGGGSISQSGGVSL